MKYSIFQVSALATTGSDEMRSVTSSVAQLSSHVWLAEASEPLSPCKFSMNCWLYFLAHENWGLIQIGISNEPEVRLRTHSAAGWEVLEVRGPMPGDVTYQWEQDILHALQRRGVSLSPAHVAGKFSGYTEAWIQEDFPAKSLAELMQLVHEDESNRPRSV
jgi:hypothetical protein